MQRTCPGGARSDGGILAPVETTRTDATAESGSLPTRPADRSDAVRAIYAHVPFCQTICGYCDFYSVVYDKSATRPLVDALLAELDRHRSATPLDIQTLFVGGGTPTTLPPEELRRLLSALRACARREPEFTVEANPATVTAEKAAVLVECGVNRVSIGAQSFDPAELRVLDRIHRPAQVAQTVAICRAAGIRRVNLDLIFAVPGQTLDSWLRNLRTAVDLAPDHLSCYGLTYEPGTPLFDRLTAGAVSRLDADDEARMYEATIDALADAGYHQYEISNFARPGCECRHNLVYWENEPHVGLGPSAAGLVGGVRYKNVPDVAEYARTIRDGRWPRIHEERLPPDQRARETAVLGLRLNAGIDRARFSQRFGNDPARLFADPIARFAELGLVEVTDRAVRLTRRGRLVADTIVAEFV